MKTLLTILAAAAVLLFTVRTADAAVYTRESVFEPADSLDVTELSYGHSRSSSHHRRSYGHHNYSRYPRYHYYRRYPHYSSRYRYYRYPYYGRRSYYYYRYPGYCR